MQLHPATGHMEKQEMKIEMEAELETEMEAEPISCWSPSKIHMLFAFVHRHPRASSPLLQFLIKCFASLALQTLLPPVFLYSNTGGGSSWKWVFYQSS